MIELDLFGTEKFDDNYAIGHLENEMNLIQRKTD
jgi:hypothetical protein